MKYLFLLLRFSILLLAVFVFLSGDRFFGFYILAGYFFSFLFRLRKPLLIPEGRAGDIFEVMGLLVVFIHALFIAFGYSLWVAVHAFGGVFVGTWASIVLLQRKERGLFFFLVALALVAFVGVVWEVHEWILDATLGAWLSLGPFQPSVADTMLDLLADILGGFSAAVLFYWRGEKLIES